MRLLGIDPGQHTGLAYWDDSHLTEIRERGFKKHCVTCETACGYQELAGVGYDGERRMVREFAGWLSNELDSGRVVDAVFCEDFILRGGQLHSSDKSGLSAVRMQALLYSWAVDVVEWDGRWVWQNAGQAKGSVGDQRLRSAGFWVPGSAHVRDAARHALLGYRRIRSGAVR